MCFGVEHVFVEIRRFRVGKDEVEILERFGVKEAFRIIQLLRVGRVDIGQSSKRAVLLDQTVRIDRLPCIPCNLLPLCISVVR